jgi:DNA-binding NarL/FixJ family response regulator
MARLLIADDHPIVRRGIRDVLEDSGMEVVAEAANADEVLSAVESARPEAVILDLSMPGSWGLELLHRLCREHPDLPVLVLSIHPEDELAVPCLKAGAAGYLSKMSPPAELVEAVTAVTHGKRYFSPQVSEWLVREAPQTAPAHEALSPREREVLCRIAAGETVREIAAALSISVKTVSTFRARILEKMNLRNNAEMMQYALRHHLLGPLAEPSSGS